MAGTADGGNAGLFALFAWALRQDRRLKSQLSISSEVERSRSGLNDVDELVVSTH
jgi:hypothetical protein